uniref:Uncharacterized protein n=1 Tax=Cacopsylla melanoneura TaxID=428564 RepID=A0A8D9EKS6_9HEMI
MENLILIACGELAAVGTELTELSLRSWTKRGMLLLLLGTGLNLKSGTTDFLRLFFLVFFVTGVVVLWVVSVSIFQGGVGFSLYFFFVDSFVEEVVDKMILGRLFTNVVG